MSFVTLRRSIRDERGIALPVAMMALVLLAGITVAFVAMAGMEPFIAANHQASHEALNLAESAVERTIWALNVPGELGAWTPVAADEPAPLAPYNGSQLIGAGQGFYSMNVTAGAAGARTARNVTAMGYVLRDGAPAPANPAALMPGGANEPDRTGMKSLQATLIYMGPYEPPAGLTSGGSVEAGGNTTVDGANSAPGTPNTCANKTGAAVRIKTTYGPGPDGVLGTADDEAVPNMLTVSGSASVTGSPENSKYVDEKTFNEKYLLSPDQLAVLKEYAKSHGTYFQPKVKTVGKLSACGATKKPDAPCVVTNGLTFIDTVDGLAPTADNMVRDVGFAAPSQYKGWVVVMGSMKIEGNVTYDGLIYAMNDIVYRGTGTGGLYGAVVSANLVDQKSTVIDTSVSSGDDDDGNTLIGNSRIYLDCDKVKNPGFKLPTGYFVKSGSWREASN
jgi:hypothetical protein